MKKPAHLMYGKKINGVLMVEVSPELYMPLIRLAEAEAEVIEVQRASAI